MNQIIDLTPPITAATAVWPGDTPFSRKMVCRRAEGASVDLSSITTTVHLGAHADGPNHYALESEGAEGVGEMGLEHYLGACQVIDAPVRRGSRVGVGDVLGGVSRISEKRVLIRTGTFEGFGPPGQAGAWNNDFAGLSPELVDALADQGVITIGIDTPSVDLIDSKDLPAHRAIFRRGIAILEGLDLAKVPRDSERGALSVYELIALPLKLMGCDGSPVRAVLRSL